MNKIYKDLNAILGEDHGTNIPKAIEWKREKVSISELLEGLKSLRASFLEAGAEKLGCKLVARKVELVYTDAKTGKSRRLDSSHLECLTYAFYRLKEEKVTQAIFFKGPIFKERSCDSQLETFIVKLGYRLVQKPQRKDLIVYLNEKGLLNHAGVMVDEKTVHSKWGVRTDEIFEHSIESIPEIYGITHVFFRKESSTLDEPWIL